MRKQTAKLEPQDYPRRVLLAVTGLSPQIVTETVYCLAVQRQPAFVPTEVRLITTAEGADRARLELLHDDTGRFHRLRADYSLPPIDFRADRIKRARGCRWPGTKPTYEAPKTIRARRTTSQASFAT